MKFVKLDSAISEYMRENGMTQADMAEKLGMAENTFSWKRRGVREFSLSEAAKVADMTGKSLDYLVSVIE